MSCLNHSDGGEIISRLKALDVAPKSLALLQSGKSFPSPVMLFRQQLCNCQTGTPPQYLQCTHQIPNRLGGTSTSFQEPTQNQWSKMSISSYDFTNDNTPATNTEHWFPARRQVMSKHAVRYNDKGFFQPQNLTISANLSFQPSLATYYRMAPVAFTDLLESDLLSISQASRFFATTSGSCIDGIFDEDRVSLQSRLYEPSGTSNMQVLTESNLAYGVPYPTSFNFASLQPVHECVTPSPAAQFKHSLTVVRREPSLSPPGENRERIFPGPKIRTRPSRARSTSTGKAGEMTVQRKRTPLTRGSQRSKSSTGPGTWLEHNISTPEESSKLRVRLAHSLVERKYRENLNARIFQLHQILRQTDFGRKTGDAKTATLQKQTEQSEDEGNIGPAASSRKFRKSSVLTEAVDYINAAELEIRHMNDQVRQLNIRVQALENFRRCEKCNQNVSFET